MKLNETLEMSRAEPNVTQWNSMKLNETQKIPGIFPALPGTPWHFLAVCHGTPRQVTRSFPRHSPAVCHGTPRQVTRSFPRHSQALPGSFTGIYRQLQAVTGSCHALFLNREIPGNFQKFCETYETLEITGNLSPWNSMKLMKLFLGL